MPKLSYMQGSGPGAITPDGCPVEFYARLRARDEPELVQRVIRPGGGILELGAGAGRVTRALLDLGYPVVAVDESPDMLAHIDGAETVCSPIEGLDLGRRFDGVLLMSYLIEVPDDALMRAFLRSCRSHVRDDGRVLLERHPLDWHDTVEPYERVSPEGFTVRMRSVERPRPGHTACVVDYDWDGTAWSHSFLTRRLDDERLEEELARAGLAIDEFLKPDRTWVSARPVPVPGG